jgi:murein L,D-transpeptidase YcbB/YkuD
MEKKLLDRIKLLSKYDTKKTLNENETIIFEQEKRSVTDLVNSFKRSTYGMVGTNIKGIKATLNNITDKTTLSNFFREIKNNSNKTFVEIINDEFENNNHEEAVELSKLLKTKFGVDSEPGIKYFDRTTSKWMQLKTSDGYDRIKNMDKEFNHKFVITNFNWEVPSSSSVQPEKESEPTPPTQRVVPQTLDEVLQGKVFLKFGDKSPAVKELQQKLINLGYSDLGQTPTDYFGNKTKSSVIDFQTKNPPLTKDGAVGKNTLLKINEILKTKNNSGSGIRLKASQAGIGSKISPTLN